MSNHTKTARDDRLTIKQMELVLACLRHCREHGMPSTETATTDPVDLGLRAIVTEEKLVSTLRRSTRRQDTDASDEERLAERIADARAAKARNTPAEIACPECSRSTRHHAADCSIGIEDAARNERTA